MLAHLSGRSYRDTHGTRTNLYLIALGETGIGKDEPRRTNRTLAELCGGVGTIADAMASGEGLEENIAKHPSLLLQADEVETLINATRGTNKNAQNLSDRLRRLFTASAGAYSLRAKASSTRSSSASSPSSPRMADSLSSASSCASSTSITEPSSASRSRCTCAT